MPDRGLHRRVAAVLAVFVAVTVMVTLILTGGSGSTSAHEAALRAAQSGGLGPSASDQQARDRADSGAAGGLMIKGVPDDPGAQVKSLLDRHGRAVTQHDRAAWLGTIASSPTSFRGDQGKVFDRVSMIKPKTWTYTYQFAKAIPAQYAKRVPGAWIAGVDLNYQLAANGPTVHRHQYLTIVPASGSSTGSSGGATTSGSWQIAGDTGGPTEPDLWDLGPITVSRASRCLTVTATANRRLGQQVTDLCVGAAKRVDAVWGRAWPRQTVLIVPGSQKQLGTILDRQRSSSTGLDNTAAITLGPAHAAAEDVLINPSFLKDYTSLGIRVVLTHELVHVATLATGSVDPPTWLSEGFADYVGFYDSGLMPREIASEALQQVDRGKVPTRLPPDADFNAAGKKAVAAYGFAWAAVKAIADQGGKQKVVAFYRAAASGSGSTQERIDRAVTSVLGLPNTQALVKRWQQELETLAG